MHAILVQALPTHAQHINKYSATVLQIAGGLVVLRSLDSNLGLFRKQNIAGLILRWFQDFPLRRRAVIVHVQSLNSGFGLGGQATLTVTRATSTVDERLADLERSIVEVRTIIRDKDVAVHRRIDDVTRRLSDSIASSQSDIKQISTQLETATVGGFKQQALGVLLAAYGVFLSAFV